MNLLSDPMTRQTIHIDFNFHAINCKVRRDETAIMHALNYVRIRMKTNNQSVWIILLPGKFGELWYKVKPNQNGNTMYLFISWDLFHYILQDVVQFYLFKIVHVSNS